MEQNPVRVKRLVYGVFEVRSLRAWRDYLGLLYGLELQPGAADSEFEMVVDDSGCRLVFRESPADDCVAAGWEASDLPALERQIRAAGFEVRRCSAEEASLRGAETLLRTRDPNGFDHEIVDKTHSNGEYMAADYGHVYEAGPLGFGHLTFMCDDLEAFEAFCVSALGLKPTDYNQPTLGPGIKINVMFLRANARHHSIGAAEVPTGGKRLNHFQLEVSARDDVGRAYDRMRKSKYRMAHHIGVHPNDNQLSFYCATPSGFQSEIGAGSDLVEEDHRALMFNAFSIWGHSMPLREKLVSFRRIWPLLLHQKLGREQRAPRSFATAPRAHDSTT